MLKERLQEDFQIPKSNMSVCLRGHKIEMEKCCNVSEDNFKYRTSEPGSPLVLLDFGFLAPLDKPWDSKKCGTRCLPAFEFGFLLLYSFGLWIPNADPLSPVNDLCSTPRNVHGTRSDRRRCGATTLACHRYLGSWSAFVTFQQAETCQRQRL